MEWDEVKAGWGKRFEQPKIRRLCPSCGRLMLEGNMISGGAEKLFWYPTDAGTENRNPAPEREISLFRWTDHKVKHPAFRCPECRLVLLDYAQEHER